MIIIVIIIATIITTIIMKSINFKKVQGKTRTGGDKK
jgi:hypothetical protein